MILHLFMTLYIYYLTCIFSLACVFGLVVVRGTFDRVAYIISSCIENSQLGALVSGLNFSNRYTRVIRLIAHFQARLLDYQGRRACVAASSSPSSIVRVFNLKQLDSSLIRSRCKLLNVCYEILLFSSWFTHTCLQALSWAMVLSAR